VTPPLLPAVGTLRRLSGGADKDGQRREKMGAREAILEIVPERQPQLLAGLLQAEERIPCRPPRVASGGRTNFAFLDIVANVIRAQVIVQRDVRAFQHQE
jgi:hypothetical protein